MNVLFLMADGFEDTTVNPRHSNIPIVKHYGL